MNKNIKYEKIYSDDYVTLTRIMTSAFDEDTSIHTESKEGGPTGYNDGGLLKKLNENKDFKSYKIIYENNIVGAYTVAIKENNDYSLEMLFISPEYREYHLGTIVWNDIEQKFLNAKRWIVETPDYSKRNHHFYTIKCGFKFFTENIYENGSKSFVFQKEL